MLLNRDTLRGIADGSITLAFRRWKRPTVKAGGTLLTVIGQLGIDSVDPIELDDIERDEARAAGFDDLQELRAQLTKRSEGDVYRISLRLVGPDPRISLREEVLEDGPELDELRAKLSRWEWAPGTLRQLKESPGVRAGDLADEAGMAKTRFKANVRRLKGLGLTESLEVGYRLSPRGEAAVRDLKRSTS